MMAETAERDAFGTHSPAYYRLAYDLFHPKGGCELFVAEFEGSPLAAVLWRFAQGPPRENADLLASMGSDALGQAGRV